MDTSPSVPTVVLLGGFGRSGSTLLERLLSATSTAVATGEVIHVWERGLLGDERCGCGESFRDCAYWTAVGDAAFGGWDSVDAQAALALRREVCTNRNILRLLTPWARPTFRRQMTAYLSLLDRLYRAVADVSGSDTLVDSSKHPSHAFLLRHGRIEPRVVLVVRDSRGVAYSWGKRVRRPEVTDHEEYMPRYSALGSAARWGSYNLLFQLLAATRTPVHVVRYEDLVGDPAPTVERVLRFAGIEPDPLALAALAEGTIDLDVDHTVAGNPMRFRTGTLAVRSDDEWRQRMPARDRRVVSAVTWPLRLRYGYVGAGGRNGHGRHGEQGHRGHSDAASAGVGQVQDQPRAQQVAGDE